MLQESRMSQRLEGTWQASVVTEDGLRLQAMCMDVSVSGVGLDMVITPEHGDRVQLVLVTSTGTLCAPGEIVRMRYLRSHRAQVGLRFTRLDRTVLESLHSLVNGMPHG